jgi:hypothetical protein
VRALDERLQVVVVEVQREGQRGLALARAPRAVRTAAAAGANLNNNNVSARKSIVPTKEFTTKKTKFTRNVIHDQICFERETAPKYMHVMSDPIICPTQFAFSNIR